MYGRKEFYVFLGFPFFLVVFLADFFFVVAFVGFFATVLPSDFLVVFLVVFFLVFLTAVLPVFFLAVDVFCSPSFSSSDLVNLHLGNPLQPINSPYRPDLFIRSLPQSGQLPTTSLLGSLSSLPHLGSRHALCLGLPN